MNIQTSKGVISAGEKAVTFTHRTHKWDGTKRAVIILAGHNGDALTPLTLAAYLDGAAPVLGDLVAAVRLGMPVVTIDAGGGQTFGNDAAIARLDEAVNWVASSGLAKGQPILAGTSMGSILAINYAARHVSKVQALALFYPAPDLQYTHDNGNAAEVEAAYGGLVAFNAAVASHRGIDQAAAGLLGAIPVKGWHATSDAVVGPLAWSQFKAALASGGSPVPGDYDLGDASHGDNTLLPLADVQGFYREHS